MFRKFSLNSLRLTPIILFLGVLWSARFPMTFVQAGEFVPTEHRRTTIYHSPEKPGFTSWCGAWRMSDGNLMVSFTQATGPVEGRMPAPPDVQRRLTWPPPGRPGYDMTGLDLKNVHLRSTDAGQTWKTVSADPFQSCMNGVTGEAETGLADGSVLRGVFGFYLPYNRDLPQTGYLQRSTDGTVSWGPPVVPLDPQKFTVWPRRIRTLRDGRLLLLAGVVPAPAGSLVRAEYAARIVPMLIVSSDQGKTWQGPVATVPADQPDGWTEEFDVAELPDGHLLCIFRRAAGAQRWQTVLQKMDQTWSVTAVGPNALPHSGQPELLATREGPVLHLATTGIHATTDAGRTWKKLDLPGTAYYPRSVQTENGLIHMFGHIGSDDAYGAVDQSIVMDSFRLVAED
ncbi:MAG: exo-alpha-sialidase [Planctomycetes bacterium]|nr:exo-alpha-sialidase [Planctomycetota bacterium]